MIHFWRHKEKFAIAFALSFFELAVNLDFPYIFPYIIYDDEKLLVKPLVRI